VYSQAKSSLSNGPLTKAELEKSNSFAIVARKHARLHSQSDVKPCKT
jgi:hypothetical protein